MDYIQREESRIRIVYAKRDTSGKPALYAWHRPDALYMEYRIKEGWVQAFKAADFQDISSLEILEVGCGAGRWLRTLTEWGATTSRLHGVDLLEDRIVKAMALSPAGIDFKVSNACSLDYPDEAFDLCIAFTVFSSVLEAEVRLSLAREMERVVRRGGWVMIFDYALSDPRNPDTIGIRKKEIIRLWPHLKLHHTFKLIFPPPRYCGFSPPNYCAWPIFGKLSCR
jgi:ubiquinone/menaquinone biosynthesis C-methylase UbiE